MLSNAGLWKNKSFWAEVISTACYLLNRSPHASIEYQIPEEVWTGNPVNYSNLRIFGCPVYVHVNDGKLSPRAVKCMFLGYGSESTGYRMWCPDLMKVIQSRDVTFNETTMLSGMESTGTSDDAGNQEKDAGRMVFEVEQAQGGATGTCNQEQTTDAPDQLRLMSLRLRRMFLRWRNNHALLEIVPRGRSGDQRDILKKMML